MNIKMEVVKICKYCGIEKNLADFHKSKNEKDGYRGKCKECVKKYRLDNIGHRLKKEKLYREGNKTKRSKENEKYRNISENKIRKKESDKSRYYLNKLEMNECSRNYYNLNKISVLHAHNMYVIERKKVDNLFKLKCLIRCLISNSIKSNGYKRKSKTFEILGCSFEEFKLHLESKFEHWMNWNNNGIYTGNYMETWQIDHIIPISSANSEEELLKINHYTNFQPLDSKINLIDKGFKIK